MGKGLEKAKLLGKGPDKLQGEIRRKLELGCKTAICESIELCREFETIEEKLRAAELRMMQCKLHFNGDHMECPEDAKCQGEDSYILQDHHKFGEKQRSMVNKVVFDDLLCSTKFIKENCLSVGSTSANENLHWIIYGRGLISKKHHKNTFSNSIEAGYKCGVLFNNEGDAGAFDILFNNSNINWPIHQTCLDHLNELQNRRKRTEVQIKRQKTKARLERNELKIYDSNPLYPSYMTPSQKKARRE